MTGIHKERSRKVVAKRILDESPGQSTKKRLTHLTAGEFSPRCLRRGKSWPLSSMWIFCLFGWFGVLWGVF